MNPVVLMITAITAVVFASCLLYRAFRERRRSSTISGGRHCRKAAGKPWRERKQAPSPVLLHALKTVGTHGLGLIRKAKPRGSPRQRTEERATGSVLATRVRSGV
jgi:hypothetical protein